MRCGVLHHWLVVPLAAAVLYGGTPALASEAAVSSPAQPPPVVSAPVPLPAVPGPRVDKPQPVPADAIPHIALLLPLNSKTFVRHAEAVRDGVLAAAKVQGGAALPVRVYAAGDDPEQVLDIYIKAINAGARIVIGPLTRNGVTAVAGSAAVIVPTLALNVPDASTALPPEVYTLSLQAEAEARQVAQLAWQDGYRRAVTIGDESPLVKRIHQAFVEEFTRLGGEHVAAYAFAADPETPEPPTWRFSRSISRVRGSPVRISVRSRSMPRRRCIPAILARSSDLTSPGSVSSTCPGCCSPNIRR